MGKPGTTSNFRDALFVGSTYGLQGITVAVRIGFDDNRELGARETGGHAALPIFREIMLRVYKAKLMGPPPKFPREIEEGIDRYLARQAAGDTSPVAATSSPVPSTLAGETRRRSSVETSLPCFHWLPRANARAPRVREGPPPLVRHSCQSGRPGWVLAG